MKKIEFIPRVIGKSLVLQVRPRYTQSVAIENGRVITSEMSYPKESVLAITTVKA